MGGEGHIPATGGLELLRYFGVKAIMLTNIALCHKDVSMLKLMLTNLELCRGF